MNGQPTAQNTRECGVNGEFIAFRNWKNPDHVADRPGSGTSSPRSPAPGRRPPTRCSCSSSPRPARSGSCGSSRPTRRYRCRSWGGSGGPSRSAPVRRRVGRVPDRDGCARRCRPAGRHLGREDGLHHQRRPHGAISREGDRSARRGPLGPGHPARVRPADGLPEQGRRAADRLDRREGAFDSWRRMQRRPPVRLLRDEPRAAARHGPIQWPCNAEHPLGKERQYEDGIFNTAAETCETYGHDLATGAAITSEQYASQDPRGRAVIKGAE